MGLMSWLRGGEEDAGSTAALGSALAEMDALFQPSRHKQTEHVDETRHKRVDVSNGAGVDLERGIAVLRRSAPPAPAEAAETAGATEAEIAVDQEPTA